MGQEECIGHKASRAFVSVFKRLDIADAEERQEGFAVRRSLPCDGLAEGGDRLFDVVSVIQWTIGGP